MTVHTAHQALLEQAAAGLALMPAADPVAFLLQQQRMALSRPIPEGDDQTELIAERNTGLQALIRHADSYRNQLTAGDGAQAQSAARAVCREIEHLLHNKRDRYAALQSGEDALLDTRVIVCADVARRVRVSPEGFRAIGPTALLVHKLRSLDTTIPYARQMAGALSLRDLAGVKAMSLRESVLLGSLFQARYRAINRCLTESEPAQVIELAAGLSPRGLHITRDLPHIVYIETDLPEIAAQKVAVVNDIVAREKSRGGFIRFEAADASKSSEIRALLNRLRDDQRTAIISEGLLIYLTLDELSGFFDVMQSALQGSDRLWIVDVVTQQNLRQMTEASPRVAEIARSVFQSTSRDVIGRNPFPDDDSAAALLERHGLKVVTTAKLTDVIAEGRVYMPVEFWRDEAIRLAGDRKIWVIRAR